MISPTRERCRTAIIVLSTSVHVSGCIIVAFGNMQPSQQMCRTARVGCRSSSRIQNPACRATSELAVRIVGQTVTAGLVVRSRSLHRRVVLRDVKIDRPRPQRVRHRLQRLVERPRRSFQSKRVRQEAILGRVVPRA